MKTKENKKTKKIVLLVVFAVVFCLSIVGVIIAKNLVMLKQNINLDQLNQGKSNNQKQNNKYVIIVGASQVTRMDWYYINTFKETNTKCNKNTRPAISKKYVKDTKDKPGNLFFIHRPGSGISHQIGKYNGELGDQTIASMANGNTTKEKEQDKENIKLKHRLINKVKQIYSKNKNAEVHVFFPLSGNTIRNYTCDGTGTKNFRISHDNKNINAFVDGYYDTIIYLKNNVSKNKKVYGYVSSMHPDVPSEATKDPFTVVNNNKNACSKGYRSNEKYYRFNAVFKDLVEKKDPSKNVLFYEPLFIQVMKIKNTASNYSYKVDYCTTDGVHWDQYTTIDWVNRMLNYSGRL